MSHKSGHASGASSSSSSSSGAHGGGGGGALAAHHQHVTAADGRVWPLLDYFLVLGGGGDGEAPQPLIPLRRTSRSDSMAIQPIRDLCVVDSPHLKDIPKGFERIPISSDKKQPAFKSYICQSRLFAAGQAGRSATLGTPLHLAPGGVAAPNDDDPITDIDVIFTDKKEAPKKGFVQLKGNLNKGAFGRDTAICISREPGKGKEPITDVILLTKASKEVPEGYTKIDKPLNAGSVSLSALRYLAYKRAPAQREGTDAYEPRLISRYPTEDKREYPLEAKGVSMLCFPRGMMKKSEPQLPTFLTLVMTQADAGEVYGAALMFYELLPLLEDEPKTTPPSYCPKVLCILSHWPFYEAFKLVLNQLYRIAVSPSAIPTEVPE